MVFSTSIHTDGIYKVRWGIEGKQSKNKSHVQNIIAWSSNNHFVHHYVMKLSLNSTKLLCCILSKLISFKHNGSGERRNKIIRITIWSGVIQSYIGNEFWTTTQNPELGDNFNWRIPYLLHSAGVTSACDPCGKKLMKLFSNTFKF
jgi:hypothetical protein